MKVKYEMDVHIDRDNLRLNVVVDEKHEGTAQYHFPENLVHLDSDLEELLEEHNIEPSDVTEAIEQRKQTFGE